MYEVISLLEDLKQHILLLEDGLMMTMSLGQQATFIDKRNLLVPLIPEDNENVHQKEPRTEPTEQIPRTETTPEARASSSQPQDKGKAPITEEEIEEDDEETEEEEVDHQYAYPNALVFALNKERKVLARENARLEVEATQDRATNEKQAARIKELEYDVLEVENRVDDLCAQLREAREHEIKRARKVRGRAESILNLCDDGLEEDSDEASCAEAEAGEESTPSPGSQTPQYAYPNALVFALNKERKVLARENARLEVEATQDRATNEKQAARIKELEYDVLEVENRVDDLCAQLREAREHEIKRARKVRGRAESILNLCDDGLEEDSDEASCAEAEAGEESTPSPGSQTP
ncbi:uncharacterized protein LOC113759170, partial [Coffea eugenioides]|uniref:uncharacterized protein LOC113759170 n=1 Tax=Coffea eugenioides TaxID=49369 RepID=UPI000F60DD39